MTEKKGLAPAFLRLAHFLATKKWIRAKFPAYGKRNGALHAKICILIQKNP